MTISADMVGALKLAGLRANADYMPEGGVEPFVVVVRTGYEPVMTLVGQEGDVRSTFVLLCKGKSKADAATLAAAASAAIYSATNITRKYREPVSGDEFDPELMENTEIVQFSIWHQ